jgi:hypothetical protein
VNTIAINPQINYTGIKDVTLSLSGYWANAGQKEEIQISVDETQEVKSHVGLISGYVRWDYKRLRLIGMGAVGTLSNTTDLYTLTQQKEQKAQVMGSQVYGAYAEAGYDLLPLFLGTVEKREKFNTAKHRVFRREHAMLPVFVRLERLNTHQAIAAGLPASEAIIQDIVSVTFGINYEPNEQMAIKVDYIIGNNRSGANKELFEFGLGLSF